MKPPITLTPLLLFLLPLSPTQACSSCYGASPDTVYTRLVRRMQPEAQNATYGPKAPLEWGQLNFLHTTDTHGWLEGHLKEQNYGADWGDFVSFVRGMREKAREVGVDLLVVDSGDLHDGSGLGDTTTPNGLFTNPIFENIDYDLLAIGNHELYVSEVAYQQFNQFAKVYGDRYVTSNVEIRNPQSGKFEYVGSPYRYFTTEQGLRIMAFGVLYDFTGNSNVSRVTKAADLVQQEWFLDKIDYKEPIDMFVVVGHNPPRTNSSTSTMGTIYQAIRKIKPDTPIQFFGGHTHVRDFFVYDNKATGLISGRYCETAGWLSMSGLSSTNKQYCATSPSSQPNPTRPAKVVATQPKAANLSLSTSPSDLKYARRYLDWNRLTFEYHARGSQSRTFDTQHGKAVTSIVTATRQHLNLSSLYGCAPQTYCLSCKPFGDPGNIYSLLSAAMAAVVVNETRADMPRLVFSNTGSTRFDIVKGPFTLDDAWIALPFLNTWKFVPDVPYSAASQVLSILNAGPRLKRAKRLPHPNPPPSNHHHAPFPAQEEPCLTPPLRGPQRQPLFARGTPTPPTRLHHHRQSIALTPGYTTVDDFGADGDDTRHAGIPAFAQPNALVGRGGFAADAGASTDPPAVVDVVFDSFNAEAVVAALGKAGVRGVEGRVGAYLPEGFTLHDVLPEYARRVWDQGPVCEVGVGVGGVR